ncbi:hypothetical protein A2U01_0104026, partial [Trifolium medium]|nr:hypothetical protein [Trifolium medium]
AINPPEGGVVPADTPMLKSERKKVQFKREVKECE